MARATAAEREALGPLDWPAAKMAAWVQLVEEETAARRDLLVPEMLRAMVERVAGLTVDGKAIASADELLAAAGAAAGAAGAGEEWCATMRQP